MTEPLGYPRFYDVVDFIRHNLIDDVHDISTAGSTSPTTRWTGSARTPITSWRGCALSVTSTG
jgi:hypothetical protein